MKIRFFLVAFVLLLTGCAATHIGAKIESFQDPSCDLAAFKRFDILPISKDGSLQEKQYLNDIKDELSQKGYIYNPNAPDVLITITYAAHERQDYIPETTYYTPVYNPGTTSYHSGAIGGTTYSGLSTTSGTWTQQLIFGGYNITTNVEA
jgi:hypothetical protein